MITVYVLFEIDDPFELPIAVCTSFREIDRVLDLGHDTARKAFKASPYMGYFEIGKYGIELTEVSL